MDDSLRLIRYLYGEDVDDSSFEHRLSEEEDLRREYERLQATKEELDARRPQRPDPEVIDVVVDAASEAASTSKRTSDRPARPPRRTWSHRLQGAAAVLALLLVVGLGWWQLGDPALEGADWLAGSEEPSASVEATAESDAVPEWDDSDELIRLHQRIEHVRSRSASDGWGDLQPVDQTRP